MQTTAGVKSEISCGSGLLKWRTSKRDSRFCRKSWRSSRKKKEVINVVVFKNRAANQNKLLWNSFNFGSPGINIDWKKSLKK